MVCIGKGRTGALLLGLIGRISGLVRLRLLLVAAFYPSYRMRGDRRVGLGPEPSCDFWPFGKAGPVVFTDASHAFEGMICVGKGLSLGFTFRSELSFCACRHVGKRLVTSSPMGGVEGVLSSRTCFWHVVQSSLQPLVLALALVFDTHNRWIMASRAGGKTKRRDRNRLGKERVPCGPLLRTHRMDAPTDHTTQSVGEKWPFYEGIPENLRNSFFQRLGRPK